MKSRTLISILILISAVLIIISSCATMLIHSAERGNYAEVKRLIEKGAEVNAQTNAGLIFWKLEYKRTALTCAFREVHTEIVKLLIIEGADVKA